MRVALLSGARNRHTHRWAMWLKRFGHEVIVFSDAPARPDMDYEKVRVVHPHWNLAQRLWVFKIRGGTYANNANKWKAYRSAILASKPDLLHAMEALAYGPMLARFPQFPRVLTPWGPDVEQLAGNDKKRNKLVLSAMRAADMIATNAVGSKEAWAKLSGEPADKFNLFPWGVEPKKFAPPSVQEEAELRKKFNLPRDGSLILSPRLAKPNYGIDLILRGWAKACGMSSLADHHLVILRAGADNDSWNTWQELARSLPVPRVIFLDEYLAEREMVTLYSTCAASINIPETDLFAMSLVEALFCKCLPILGEIPAYRWFFDEIKESGEELSAKEDKGAAVFLRTRDEDGMADALVRWSKMLPGEREMLTEKNQRLANVRLTWETSTRQMDRVYQMASERFYERTKPKARK